MKLITIDMINDILENSKNDYQEMYNIKGKNICQIATQVYNSLSLQPMMNSDFDYVVLSSKEIAKVVYDYFEKLDPSLKLVQTIKHYVDGNGNINIYEPSSDKTRKTSVRTENGMILVEIYPKNDTSAFYTFAETFINILNANGTNINNRFSLLQTQFIRDTLSDYLINNNIVNNVEGKKMIIRNINYVRGLSLEILMKNYINKYLDSNPKFDMKFVYEFAKTFNYSPENAINYLYAYVNENLEECHADAEKMFYGNILGERLYELYKKDQKGTIDNLKEYILKENYLSYEDGIKTLGLVPEENPKDELDFFLKGYTIYALNNLSNYTDGFIKRNRIFDGIIKRGLIK